MVPAAPAEAISREDLRRLILAELRDLVGS
jgi:hypothetical protein